MQRTYDFSVADSGDRPADILLPRQTPCLRRLVKLGGAAITNKSRIETLNKVSLEHCAKALADAISYDKSEEKDNIPVGQHGGTAVVHGAGSFGHHQASEGKVASGGLELESVRKGFLKTRLSVTKLQHFVVESLVEEGVEAVGISPLGKWTTADRQLLSVWSGDFEAVLGAGFVPVLHGDCVLDESTGCTILSGDTIMSHLARKWRPDIVVFLTDVDGVFSRPPGSEGARLLSTIRVSDDGTWEADGLDGEVSMLSSGVDTTGGIAKKVEEAAGIALAGPCGVVIAKAGTEDARAALALGPAACGEAGTRLLGRPFRGTLVVRAGA